MDDEALRVDSDRSPAFRIAERIAELYEESDADELNTILQIVTEELANG